MNKLIFYFQDVESDVLPASQEVESPVPATRKFDPTGYNNDLVESLERDIVQRNPNVRWYDK